jgi:hypothetical protein
MLWCIYVRCSHLMHLTTSNMSSTAACQLQQRPFILAVLLPDWLLLVSRLDDVVEPHLW